jgi:hypothetical protein
VYLFIKCLNIIEFMTSTMKWKKHKPLCIHTSLMIKLHISRCRNSVNLMTSCQSGAVEQAQQSQQSVIRASALWHDRAWSLRRCGHVCDIMSTRPHPSLYYADMDMVYGYGAWSCYSAACVHRHSRCVLPIHVCERSATMTQVACAINDVRSLQW